MALQLRLLKTYRGQQLPWMQTSGIKQSGDHGIYAIGIFLVYAAAAESTCDISISPFVDELDRVNSLSATDWHAHFYKTWRSPRVHGVSCHSDVLSIAALAGLSRYIAEQYESGSSAKHQARRYPLLCSAVDLIRQDTNMVTWSKKLSLMKYFARVRARHSQNQFAPSSSTMQHVPTPMHRQTDLTETLTQRRSSARSHRRVSVASD